MFLQFKKFCSPSKFEFQDPDLPKKKYTATSYEALYKQIRGYRSQNELPEIEFLEVVVENYICRMKGHEGSCQPRPALKRGLMQTLKGGVALVTALAYKSFVSQEIAGERSEICKDCPKNTFPDTKGFVKWSDELALMSIGERKSKFHDELGTCEVCLCPMRCKVWHPGPFKFSDKEMKEFPDFCWQKKEVKRL